MRKIGGIFGRKPFGPLNEHMLKVTACLDVFSKMMNYFIEGNFEEAQKAAEKVTVLENESDIIKNEIKRLLSGSIFNAAQRAEIMQLLKAEDDLSDGANDIANIIILRKTLVPEPLKEPFKDLLALIVDVCRKFAHIIRELQDFEHGSFEGKDFLDNTARDIEEVHTSEHPIDALRAKILKELFEMESKVDVLTILMLKDIIEKMHKITSQAENAADAVGRLLFLHT